MTKNHRILEFAAVLTILVPIFSEPSQAALPASDHGTAPEYYGIDFWREGEGLPQARIRTIIQTQDGYLWLGTDNGAIRFNGATFTAFTPQTGSLRDSEVWALEEDDEGGLWIGTFGGGVTLLKNGRFKTFTTHDGLPDDMIKKVDKDLEGNIWMATSRGAGRYSRGDLKTYTTKDGLAQDFVTALAAGKAGVFVATDTILHRYHMGRFWQVEGVTDSADGRINDLLCGSDGSLWISCENAVIKRWRNGVVTTYARKHNLSVGISRLYEDPKGTLWVASQRGLLRLKDDSFQTIPLRRSGTGLGVAYCACTDREGTLWVGLESDGLARLRVNQLRTLTAEDGLPSDSTRSVFEDSRGDIWVGTASGFARYKDGRTWSYKEVDGEPIGAVLAFAEDQDGALWIGAGHEVLIMKKGRLTKLPGWKRVPEIKVIYKDRTGRMWVGTDGDGLFEYGNGTMRAYRVEDGLPSNQIRALLSDRRGALWIATMGGGVCRLADGRFTAYTTGNGLASNRAVAIHEGDDGALWFATREGLCRLKDNKFATVRAENGLRESFIYAILDDGIDQLWFSCASGVFRVRKADLNAVADGRLKTLRSIDYGERDGMRTRACNVGNWPYAWRTKEGLLLFCSMKGIVIADPLRIFSNSLIPPVHIETVKINDQARPVDHLPSIPAGAGEVEIHYAALSYQAAEKVRFKYLLEGFNQEWIDAGARRFAYYANLPAGSYRFRVKACNNDGVWNETGAFYAFLWSRTSTRPGTSICLSVVSSVSRYGQRIGCDFTN
jgi:ligand-binding sensor domain-containing protein